MDKEPVALIVWVDGPNRRWFLAAVRAGGAVTPLSRSANDDLAAYGGLPLDEEVSFLRHRLCGVLQRGYDQLRPLGQKPAQFAILFSGPLPDSDARLVGGVAENLAEWMLSPPIVVFEGPIQPRAAAELHRVAGSLTPNFQTDLATAMPVLAAKVAGPEEWELSTRKGTWQSVGSRQ